MTSNDNDNVEPKLEPSERHIYNWARTHPDEPFCRENFIEKYAKGTIRNAFSKLAQLKLIKFYCHSGYAFYVHSSAVLKEPHKPLTIAHKVGKCGTRTVQFDFYAFLDSLEWEEVCKVHDVVFGFQVSGLYDRSLKGSNNSMIQNSEDIRFGSFKWSHNRISQVILHRNGKVTCYLKCSHCPIEVTYVGLVKLTSFLGSIRTRLNDAMALPLDEFNEHAVPDVGTWTVVQWHYGKDGKREISGPAFNVTFMTWADTLARIYMKKSGQLFKARMETAEKPGKTLPEAFDQKMNPRQSEQ